MKKAMLAATLMMVASSVNAEPLSLDTVISLAKAGIGDEAIVAKIKASDTHMDLSVDQMIDLKSKGLSSAVIAALVALATLMIEEAQPLQITPKAA